MHRGVINGSDVYVLVSARPPSILWLKEMSSAVSMGLVLTISEINGSLAHFYSAEKLNNPEANAHGLAEQ